MINVSKEFLDHNGGTKFYEMILLSNGTDAVLIKRYGPISSRSGGGQTKVETGSEISMKKEMVKTLRSKRAGGYEDAKAPLFGLHNGPTELTTAQVDDLIGKHYPHAVCEQIRNVFGDGSVEDYPEPEEPPVPREEVYVDRGNEWGSF